jgi:SAM-dependent methyltransferase
MSFDDRWETDIYAKSLQVNRYPFDQVVSTVFNLFGNSDRSKVDILELGCGTANNIAFLAQEGFNATGVDGSPNAIELGRKFLDALSLNATLDCFDFSDLSRYADETFDMVIDRGSITHNNRQSITDIIPQVKRILKPNGIFLSVMFSDAHSGVKVGTKLPDGSYKGFSSGHLKDHKFVFYFASEEDTVEFFDKNFEVLSKLHKVSTDHTVNDDIRAMWSVLCRKIAD